MAKGMQRPVSKKIGGGSGIIEPVERGGWAGSSKSSDDKSGKKGK